MTTLAWMILHVTNLDAHIPFFTGYLGWSLAERPAHDVAALRDTDGEMVLLAGPEAGDLTAYHTANALIKRPGDTLRLQKNDVEAFYHHLLQRGLDTVSIDGTRWEHVLTVPAPDEYTLIFRGPTPFSQDELLALYLQGPQELVAVLAGLTEQDLDLASAPGAWTIRQLTHHIVDGDTLWALLTKAALASPGSAFINEWYNANNACAVPLDYAGRPVASAVALFSATRTYTEQLLRHLSDKWQNTVLFKRADMSEPYPVSVETAVYAQARHALEHIEEIREILRAAGKVAALPGTYEQ